MNAAELLEQLVNVPSISGNETALADLLEDSLGRDGFEVERESNSIWFTLRPNDSPRLLFLSHLDTVPPCGGWDFDPFRLRRDGEKLIGLGANDAKGCVTAIILAAQKLADSDLGGATTFAFVAEEETGGAGIRAIKPKLGAIDAAIVGEPTALEVCLAQRGLLQLRCTALGESAHAAHAQLGQNAIFKAARDITKLAAMEFEPHHSLGQTRPQVTQVAGGLARNQIPDRCEFFVDLRTTPNLAHAAVTKEIADTLESDVAVHSDHYVAVATNESESIVRAALAAAKKLRGVGSNTASDWSFIAEIPAIKIGPGDTHRSHRPNEYVTIAELEAGAKFYEQTARKYFEIAAKEHAHV